MDYVFTAANGVSFLVHVLRKGDRYDLNNCKVHDSDEPLVEFYDRRFPHTELGQFVSRYYAKTIAKHIGGLDLVGYEPSWKVDGVSMAGVRNYLKEQLS